MKIQRSMHKRHFIFILLLFLGLGIQAQDIPTLLKRLKTANTVDKATIANQLAQKFLIKDGVKAIEYADIAISSAKKTGNAVVEAEALYFKAQATAGIYPPNKTVPNRRKGVTTSYYYDASKYHKAAMSKAKAQGYTQLELNAIENLAYINTKRFDRHDPDPREEKKYLNMYIDRIKQIKKVSKPQATANVKFTGSPTVDPKPKPTEKPTNNVSATTAVKKLKKENTQLKDENEDLKSDLRKVNGKIKTLNKEIKVLDGQLAKATGGSAEEMQQVREELERRQKELEDLNKKKRRSERKLKEEVKNINEKLDDAETIAEEATVKANRFQQGILYGGGAALFVLGVLYLAYAAQKRGRRKLAEKNEIIKEAQADSERLLLNILPANIAEELKVSGTAKAREHKDVSVLFSDFKNFTKLSESLSPEQLVKELDYCFKGFDHIIEGYPSIEKIKTIGDAYMCCSGLSGKDSAAAKDMVNAAMEMQEFLF
ncbi:MAG: adenylate/guanylate cyclase domain-containing protein, partial [Saprospiraceae bacterium]